MTGLLQGQFHKWSPLALFGHHADTGLAALRNNLCPGLSFSVSVSCVQSSVGLQDHRLVAEARIYQPLTVQDHFPPSLLGGGDARVCGACRYEVEKILHVGLAPQAECSRS